MTHIHMPAEMEMIMTLINFCGFPFVGSNVDHGDNSRDKTEMTASSQGCSPPTGDHL